MPAGRDTSNPSISLPNTLLAAVDAAVKIRNTTRSHIIREALLHWLLANRFPTSAEPEQKVG